LRADSVLYSGRLLRKSWSARSKFGASISRLNQNLDEELDKFAGRRLEDPYPYLILDARKLALVPPLKYKGQNVRLPICCHYLASRAFRVAGFRIEDHPGPGGHRESTTHENLELVTARNPWERIQIGQSAPRSHQEQ